MNSPRKRLLALDVFRGITIAGMILVNSPGNGTAYPPLEHADWNGCTPTDLVFPFFVFILGAALVFSFAARKEKEHKDSELYAQIFKRTLIIFALGLFLNGFPHYDLTTIRIMGVLQRIALCYFFAAVLTLNFPMKKLAWIAGGILIGYWILLKWVPVPGFGAGDLTREGSWPAYLDRLLLKGHTYRTEYDPEGILSTLPAVATALLGVLTGHFLITTDENGRERLAKHLLAAGAVGLIVGKIWGYWFPINKALWSSSYVLFTGGAALILLAICYWLIEIKGHRRWSYFFEVFGVNGLAAYVVSILDLKIQNRIPMQMPDGSMGNLRLVITQHLFGWTSEMNASLLYAMVHTLIWFFILRELHRRKIFIKI